MGFGTESEEISSGGDISESSLLAKQYIHDRQHFDLHELNLNYNRLRAKLDQEFEEKRKEWERLKVTHGKYWTMIDFRVCIILHS